MSNILGKINKSDKPLFSIVKKDEFIEASEKAFDCIFDGESRFYPWVKPDFIPNDFRIGVIYGGSGTGKSTLLKEFGEEELPNWEMDKSIVSHFNNPDDAINRLGAVGLNTIPSWYKPYHVLSNGEKFRADLARKIKSGAVVDEFTSVVDRNVAKAASVALSRFVKNNNIKNIVLSTCHEDIIDWLEPDWVINTNTGEVYDSFFLADQISISKYIVATAISGQCLRNIII